ncbi:MAG TPA: hypothetical protein VFT66_15775 [Roseiflexaceae bacterium]|nr:hypothetical protein [Roseiflexaceae bacterium]
MILTPTDLHARDRRNQPWRAYKAATDEDERQRYYQAWRRAISAYVAALPDDGSGDDIGDPGDEGDAYPRTAVR